MINEQKLREMDDRERIAFLRGHADHCEVKKVPVPLNPDERAESEHQVTDLFVKMSDIQEEKKKVDKGYNDQIAELRDQLKVLAGEVKSGNRIEKRQVFEVLNDDTGMLEEYTEDGLLLSSRRAPRHHQRGLRAVHDNPKAVNQE